MKKIFMILTAMFGFSTAAQASMMVEPYIGMLSGTAKYTYTSTFGGTSGDIKNSGTAFGLRLGYQFLIPYVALDYTSMSGKSKAPSGDTDFTGSQLGVVVGASLPFVRPYAGYGFSNELKIKAADASSSDSTLKGTYTKVGLGLGFIPIIHVNIEYIIDNYSTIEAGTYKKSDIYTDFSSTTTLLTISYPITF